MDASETLWTLRGLYGRSVDVLDAPKKAQAAKRSAESHKDANNDFLSFKNYTVYLEVPALSSSSFV